MQTKVLEIEIETIDFIVVMRTIERKTNAEVNVMVLSINLSQIYYSIVLWPMPKINRDLKVNILVVTVINANMISITVITREMVVINMEIIILNVTAHVGVVSVNLFFNSLVQNYGDGIMETVSFIICASLFIIICYSSVIMNYWKLFIAGV